MLTRANSIGFKKRYSRIRTNQCLNNRAVRVSRLYSEHAYKARANKRRFLATQLMHKIDSSFQFNSFQFKVSCTMARSADLEIAKMIDQGRSVDNKGNK